LYLEPCLQLRFRRLSLPTLDFTVLWTGNRWMFAALGIVGIVLSPVLVGFGPFVGDPELMYQPIKTELTRALSMGALPFWSDRFGLGIPLIAESHVAAFYPPNWLFYRLWDVPTAYQLTLYLHMLALTGLTYLYARLLGISRPGSALAAISFALCGFQAVHAVHEPFYHLMPYLPLCLLLADRYATTGRWTWLASLALAWGVQITLGHFQIQMWTGGLVLFTGGWRALTSQSSWPRRLGRVLGLGLGLAWGLTIAWVQLQLTWELTGVSGFVRPPQFLANFLLPPAHWAQLALPEVFLGRSSGLGETYWNHHGTTAGEACAYAGVVPLLLAFIGALAVPRFSGLTLWRLIVPLSLALATMPGWWPDLFLVLLKLPGLGWFRAPARYTLLTSLGLALFAGRGVDHLIPARRFWRGFALAIFVGLGAWVWSIHWASSNAVQMALGVGTVTPRFIATGLVWVLAITAIVSWRLKRLGAWTLLLAAALELGGLFYTGPVQWRWATDLQQESPVLAKLATLGEAGLIAGRTLNLPVVVGRTTAYPNLGITPPPPNYLLESATLPPGDNNLTQRRWQRRFGVSHGVWGSTDDVRGTEILAEIADPALDKIMMGSSSSRRGGLGPWKLVKELQPFPTAWVARRIHQTSQHTHKEEEWGELYTTLSLADGLDDAWFLSADAPVSVPGTAAQAARVESWDGRTAVVAHDGNCILILRRTYYPGWIYQVNSGPEQPVLRVNGGLQGIQLTGSGTSQVVVRYHPTGLRSAVAMSLTGTIAAVLILITAGLKTIYLKNLARLKSL
jgi:hypothetical protein